MNNETTNKTHRNNSVNQRTNSKSSLINPRYLKIFGFHEYINWGLLLFFSAIGTGIAFTFKHILIRSGFVFSVTSLSGFTILMPFLVLFALLIPTAITVTHFHLDSKDIFGKFLGVGPIVLSFLSGVPIMLITVALHNFSAYLWLRAGNTMVFPAFFCISNNDGAMETILSLIITTLIPALGYSVFFFGLLWSSFKSSQKNQAAILIAFVFAVFGLNVVDFFSLFVIGLWLCFVRSRVGNSIAVFFCLFGNALTSLWLGKIIKSVDITMLQTYSDIDKTYFYASLPALFVGIILLMFFAKNLNTYRFQSTYGLFGEDFQLEERVRTDAGLEPMTRGLCPALLIAAIIFAFLWYFVFKI